MALDDREEWFRYHHLFGELLRTELERADAGLWRQRCIGRAAAWHHEHGDEETRREPLDRRRRREIALAAEPAFNAWRSWSIAARSERAKQAARPVHRRRSCASEVPLIMAAAWFYGTVIGDRENGERWIRAARLAPRDDRRLIDGSTWRSFQLSLRAFLAPEGIGQMLRDAEEALALEPNRSPSPTPRACSGWLTTCPGIPAERTGCSRSSRAPATTPPLRAYASAFRALLACDERRWDDAVTLEERRAGSSARR